VKVNCKKDIKLIEPPVLHSIFFSIGHATMIGDKSGKCINYCVKSTDCRKCLFTDDPIDHDCRKNFSGSAKSMESAIVVDLVSNLMDME
jgi:hypothetical protein